MALLEGTGKLTAWLGRRGRKSLMAIAIVALFMLNLNGALAAGSASIIGYVWYDDNGNGELDQGEDGLAGVTVDLYRDNDGDGVLDPNDTYLDTRTTAGDGSYGFDDWSTADYIVQVPETVKLGLEEYALTTDNPLTISLEGKDYSDANFGYEGLGSSTDAEPTAVTLSSFMASSASRSASSHWPGLAVLATLAAGSTLWIRRR